jgi:hypothetical protein
MVGKENINIGVFGFAFLMFLALHHSALFSALFQ